MIGDGGGKMNPEGPASRRQFLSVTGAALVGAGVAAEAARAQDPAPLTAGQVIERIQKNVGVPWRNPTVDTFKAGSPDTPVTGIATTVMATFAALQRAAAANRNLVITHEPTFYNHEDKTEEFAGDAVFTAKQAFIEKNKMVVFRFHDHLHARRPDGIMTGMVESLGWEKYRSDNRTFALPPASLEAMAREIRDRLKIRTIRVIGDPQASMSRVAFNPGFASLQGAVRSLARPEVDVLVIGESREWEGIEYAQDAIAAGKKKGLIILGHAISEENGMIECARWMKTFVPEVPVEFTPAGEPFWTPA
jgi:putative NIF3 family GTP cyclohydrolase 1 type 2